MCAYVRACVCVHSLSICYDVVVVVHESGGNNVLMKPSVKVVSNTVTGNTRTVTLTRPLAGMTSDYYSFSMTSTDVTTPFISAVGSGAAFAYHKNKAIGTLSFLPANGGACICPEAPKAFGQATGKLTYSKTGQKEDVGTGAVPQDTGHVTYRWYPTGHQYQPGSAHPRPRND